MSKAKSSASIINEITPPLREKNGKKQRPSKRQQREAIFDEPVFAKRAKQVGRNNALDPRASTYIGRLLLSDTITEEQYGAAERLAYLCERVKSCDVATMVKTASYGDQEQAGPSSSLEDMEANCIRDTGRYKEARDLLGGAQGLMWLLTMQVCAGHKELHEFQTDGRDVHKLSIKPEKALELFRSSLDSLCKYWNIAKAKPRGEQGARIGEWEFDKQSSSTIIVHSRKSTSVDIAQETR